MKKRVFQKWLVSSMLIVCIICATLCLLAPNLTSQPSVGPEIRYYYNDSADALVATADSSEFVREIEPSETVDSVYVLDYEPYDMDWSKYADLNGTKAEADEVRKDFVARAKAYYSSRNQEFLSSMGIDKDSQDYEVVVSNYSPYVQISYEDKSSFQKYEKSFIDRAKSNSDIREIHVTVPIELEPQAAATTSVRLNYDMKDVLSDIGADDQKYTGSGLVVGIIEGGGIATENSHLELSDLNIYTNGDSPNPDIHARDVTRLLCGSNGVARGINTVYIYYAPKTFSYISAMNWFIENYCFVVNASLCVGKIVDNKFDDTYYAGQYIWASAFFDFQVRYNRVIFVNSAGNNGDKSKHYVTPPGTGYNAITVANSTKNAYIYNGLESSSYGVEPNLKMNKPTLAAPGTGLVIGGEKIGFGTSYSAPIVTGVILKLLEEKPFLQLFPEAVSAILMVSATNAYGQNDKWDERAGAGIVNYARAREVLNNYCGIFLNTNDSPYSIVASSELFTAKSGNKIRMAAIWSANSKTNALDSKVETNIHTNYDLLFNFVGDNDVLMRQCAQKTNMEFSVYKISLLSQSNFRIDIKQIGNKIINDTDYGAVAIYIE